MYDEEEGKASYLFFESYRSLTFQLSSDESDVVTHRDIATARFIRNHEFLADLFGPESARMSSERLLALEN